MMQALVVGTIQGYARACAPRCRFAVWRAAFKARKYAFMKKDAETVQAVARAAMAQTAVTAALHWKREVRQMSSLCFLHTLRLPVSFPSLTPAPSYPHTSTHARATLN